MTTNTFVGTSDGREIPYDKLLITTGGDLRTIDDHRREVCYLRGVDDADHILQRARELKPGDAAHVYGGGFIALEFINAFAHFDLNTTVSMRGDGFWSKTLGDHAKSLMAKQLADHDVELKTLITADQFSSDAQIIGVGIGMDCSMAFVKDAGIEVDRGIIANEYLETNVKGVYTAGDIAQYQDVTVGRSMIAGNWMNALMQGRTVAKTLLGDRTRFELVSSYATNLLGLEVVFVGDTNRGAADDVIVHTQEDDASLELFVRDGKTVGAILIGETKPRQAITNAIKLGENYA